MKSMDRKKSEEYPMEMKKDSFFGDFGADINIKAGRKNSGNQMHRTNQWNFRDQSLHMKTKDQFVELMTPLKEKIEGVFMKHSIKKAEYQIFDEPMRAEKEEENLTVVEPTKTFDELSLSKPLMRSIGLCEYYSPTKIQVEAIPIILKGEDVIGSAVTGSGKTAAYLLPLLEKMLHKSSKFRYQMTRVLIIVPTRELAIQCKAMLNKLKQFTEITDALAIGGVSLHKQEADLQKTKYKN